MRTPATRDPARLCDAVGGEERDEFAVGRRDAHVPRAAREQSHGRIDHREQREGASHAIGGVVGPGCHHQDLGVGVVLVEHRLHRALDRDGVGVPHHDHREHRLVGHGRVLPPLSPVAIGSILNARSGCRKDGAITIPFSTMDEMFLHLDEPTRPLVVHVEVRVAGAIDETRLRDAIRDAVGRHPLARARLRPWPSDARHYEWVVDDELHVDPLRVLDADTDPAGTTLDDVRGDFFSRAIPLVESPPFRVLLVHDRVGRLRAAGGQPHGVRRHRRAAAAAVDRPGVRGRARPDGRHRSRRSTPTRRPAVRWSRLR